MKSAKKSKLWRNVKNARYIYLLIFPAIVFYIIFNYIPMYGVRIAFQDFFPRLGISGSPSVGWDNFRYIFAQTEFWRAFRNTGHQPVPDRAQLSVFGRHRADPQRDPYEPL